MCSPSLKAPPRPAAGRRSPARRSSARLQQESHGLADVLGPDHVLGLDVLADELRHVGVDEAGAQRDGLDAVTVELLVHRLRPGDHRRLGGGVDAEPRLAGLARDRRRVDHERVSVLGARGAQEVGALAVEQDDRPQVDVELHVDPLGDDVGDGRADAHAGVVDEHVEAPPALAVGGGDRRDPGLVGHVGRDLLDLEAGLAQPVGRGRELLGAPRGHRQPVALLAQHARDGQADAARGSGYEGGAVRHERSFLRADRRPNQSRRSAA